MEHEHASTPEHKEITLPTGVFNLEKLPPEHLISLIEAVYEASAPKEDPSTGDHMAGEVYGIIGQDLEALAETSPEKAYELYEALTANGVNWSKQMAIDRLAIPLAKHYAETGETEKRRAIIDRWVSLLDDDNEEVRLGVDEALALLEDEEIEREIQIRRDAQTARSLARVAQATDLPHKQA